MEKKPAARRTTRSKSSWKPCAKMTSLGILARSLLEGGDCSFIQLGERVLASRKLRHKSLLFDAEVEEALCIRHSKKISCSCTFVVKWIDNGLEGEIAEVPSTDIMKISTKSINIHPTIFAFFNLMTLGCCSSVSPLITVTEAMDCEMDINELEKQIEEISHSVDALRMKSSPKLQFEEVDVKGQSKFDLLATSKASNTHIQLLPFVDCIKGPTGQSEFSMLMGMEVKGPPALSPFMPEEFAESRSTCNPIAVRAALASLMSKLYQSAEISSGTRMPKKPDLEQTNEHIAMKSSSGSPPFTLSFVNNLPDINGDHSLQTEASTAISVPKYESVAKELFPTKESIKKPQEFRSISWSIKVR